MGSAITLCVTSLLVSKATTSPCSVMGNMSTGCTFLVHSHSVSIIQCLSPYCSKNLFLQHPNHNVNPASKITKLVTQPSVKIPLIISNHTSFLVSKATASVVRRFQSHFVFVSCSWTPITWVVLMLTASLRS